MSTVRSQGRGALLKVGIALSLVGPAPAWARQPGEAASEWRTETPKKTTDTSEDIVLDDAPGKKKAGASNKKPRKPRAAAIKAQVEKAEAERAPLAREELSVADEA